MSLYQVTVSTWYDTGEVEKVGSGGTMERPVTKTVNSTTFYVEARTRSQAEEYAKKLYVAQVMPKHLRTQSSSELIVETARDEE